MACIPIPELPQPSLPGGITLGADLPVIDIDAKLCCKLAHFSSPPTSIAVLVTPTALAAAAVAVRAGIQAIQAYVDAIPFKCPRE